MIKTLLFKLILAIYFLAWAPFLLVGLVFKPLNDFLVLKCAAGVLVLARVIGGIDYQVHYPQTEENGVPVMPNGNNRLDGKAIIAAKHM